MSLAKLMKLVPPPERPFEVGNARQWKAIETALGIKLPKDYFDFTTRYGTGQFPGDFEVLNPFSKDFRSTLDGLALYCDYARMGGLRHFLAYRTYYTYEPAGPLPAVFLWGGDSNGNRYYWLMEGSPKGWPIITGTPEEEYVEWNMSLTAFLVKVFSNEIKGQVLPEPFTKEARVFTPKQASGKQPRPAKSAVKPTKPARMKKKA